jgi:hypothetical protein
VDAQAQPISGAGNANGIRNVSSTLIQTLLHLSHPPVAASPSPVSSSSGDSPAGDGTDSSLQPAAPTNQMPPELYMPGPQLVPLISPPQLPRGNAPSPSPVTGGPLPPVDVPQMLRSPGSSSSAAGDSSGPRQLLHQLGVDDADDEGYEGADTYASDVAVPGSDMQPAEVAEEQCGMHKGVA